MNKYLQKLLFTVTFFITFGASTWASPPPSGPIGDLEAALAEEEAARIAADSDLQGQIDAEETARIAADSALQGQIVTEESARIGADSNLQWQIDALFDELPTKVVPVNGGGSSVENGQALLEAIAGLGPSPYGYLIKLAPGTYNVGTTPVSLPVGVSILGSGSALYLTHIVGNVNQTDAGLITLSGSNQLRHLSVRNDTGEIGTAVGVYHGGSGDSSLIHVNVSASGGDAYGVKVIGSGASARIFAQAASSIAVSHLGGTAVAWEVDGNATLISWRGGLFGDGTYSGDPLSGTSYALRLHNGGSAEMLHAILRARGNAVYVRDEPSIARLMFTTLYSTYPDQDVDPPDSIDCAAAYRMSVGVTELDEHCRTPSP
jgi:hypothetical protein